MNRVVVTRAFIGICGMQVCACKDATDEEILSVCNSENPSGTSNGWSQVVRQAEEGSLFQTEKSLPVQCADDPGRLHFMVLC
jgi:hypothetical protein